MRERREKQVERLEAQNRELTRTLRLSEEARAVLADQYDFAPVGFVTLDAKGCVREINLTAVRMVGRKRAPLLGMPFFTHIAKPHLPTFLHHLRACRAGSGEVISEAALQAGGGALPVELRSVPVLDPRRGDTVYRTTIIDITARLRTSQALRQSEERYRELVELSPDGIFITSAGTIVFANRAALRLCGVERAEALFGGEFIIWAHPAYRAALRALLLRPFTDHETPPVEARFAREDGTTVDVEVVARPLRRADERPAALVVARDITRRKTAERHVLKISERERAGFGRDLHDSLCQSLMGAAFLTDALRKDLKDAQPRAAAAAEKVARVVRSCGEEARNLARGLCPVTMEQHGLVAALHELAGEVGARMKVDCALQCDDHLAIEDASRATHLYRIAQEAISNAIRHGRAKSVLIQLTANNGKMALRIEDNGKGIAAKPKQSGMGLHTMRYRASLIGGSLDVQRLLPRGTAVTCTFSNHTGNR